MVLFIFICLDYIWNKVIFCRFCILRRIWNKFVGKLIRVEFSSIYYKEWLMKVGMFSMKKISFFGGMVGYVKGFYVEEKLDYFM